MSRTLLLVLALLGGVGPAAHAQGAGPLVKYGKWFLAAGALGMNYLASQAHERAEDQFHLLESRCAAPNQRRCDLGPNGRYLDGDSELLFQQSLRYDHQARGWLFGGETALLGAAAMFVWELTRHSPKPDNIPFVREVWSLRWGTGVGVRMKF
jgi:hypothetical protein